jgi:hypothetical protein
MKEQQPAGARNGIRTRPLTRFQPYEVSPAYGIFHYVFKKGQKATGEETELLCEIKSPGGLEPPAFPSGTL